LVLQSLSVAQLSPAARLGMQPTPTSQRSAFGQPHSLQCSAGATSQEVGTPSIHTYPELGEAHEATHLCSPAAVTPHASWLLDPQSAPVLQDLPSRGGATPSTVPESPQPTKACSPPSTSATRTKHLATMARFIARGLRRINIDATQLVQLPRSRFALGLPLAPCRDPRKKWWTRPTKGISRCVSGSTKHLRRSAFAGPVPQFFPSL